jgi:hypothetical protein
MRKFIKTDHCGCAMGAKFMAVGMLLASVYYGRLCCDSELSVWVMLLKVFVSALIATGAGKMLGILLYRHQARKRVIASN